MKRSLLCSLLDELEIRFQLFAEAADTSGMSCGEIVSRQNQIYPLLEVLEKASGVESTRKLLERLRSMKLPKHEKKWYGAVWQLQRIIAALEKELGM